MLVQFPFKGISSTKMYYIADLSSRLKLNKGNLHVYNSTDNFSGIILHVDNMIYNSPRKKHYLQHSQKGPVKFTGSVLLLALLSVVLSRKQGIL